MTAFIPPPPRRPKPTGSPWIGVLIVAIICATQLACAGIVAWAVK